MNKACQKGRYRRQLENEQDPCGGQGTDRRAHCPLVKDAGCDVVVCVPYRRPRNRCRGGIKGTNIKIGAENVPLGGVSGAFTGEISADMLKAVGVEYVIIGHSERRQYFGETDVTVNKKVAGRAGRRPHRHRLRGRVPRAARAGHHRRARLPCRPRSPCSGVTAEELKHVIIAYEPVWAIGTGKTATARAGQRGLRLSSARPSRALYGEDGRRRASRIQYGGSHERQATQPSCWRSRTSTAASSAALP